MLNRFVLRFVSLCACVWFAVFLLGCGASYEIKPTASSLPSQAEMDRLAVPADLLAKLNRILAESGKTAENERPDPRYIAQSDSRYTSVEDRLVLALLQWGVDKYVDSKQPAKAPEPAPVVAAKPLTLEDPRVQFAEGTVAGALVGAVPLGSVGADVAIELHILPNGTYWAQVGRACGEIGIGLAQIAVACTGVGAGIGMSGTGGGAAVGIVLISESLVIGYNGLLTTANGFRHAQQLAHEGPPSAPDVATPELLRPPRKPATQAPVAAAPPPKPAAPTAPTQTTTKTVHKGPNGEIIKTVTKTGDNVTTSRPKKAPSPQPTGQTSGPGKPVPNTAKPSPAEGWRVGDDIYKPTAKGEAPNWSTVRARYWKNEATKSYAAERYGGAENVERMKRGLAPQKYNEQKGGWESMDLSHEPTPAREGGTSVVPRWPQDHANIDPHRRPGY